MARTVDNLGVEISTRWAQDQAELAELGFDLKESYTVPQQAKIITTTPFQPSEFDLLFETGKRGKRWALILPPPNYYSSRRNLFSAQILPSLGTPDKQEAQIERLEAVEEDADDERKKVLYLLKEIHELDRNQIEINSRLNQYQRG